MNPPWLLEPEKQFGTMTKIQIWIAGYEAGQAFERQLNELKTHDAS